MKVLVGIYSSFSAWNIPEEHVARLRQRFPGHLFVHARSEPEVLPPIADADIAFMSELRAHHLAAAPRLRWVHSPAAGVGGMLYPEMLASPVLLSNSRGMSADTIAEHVIALALAIFRKLPLAINAQSAHRWVQNETLNPPVLRMISGSHVLLIGLGGIGAATSDRFAALGARVSAIRRRPAQPAPRSVTAVASPDRLLDLLPTADIVVLAAPQTSATRELIGVRELAAMRRDALLINVSRGKLVDERALADALLAGRLGGAGLDVFEHEPLDPSSPLWDVPTVVITPHTAGFRADHWDAATELFASNLERFEKGEPLLNVVDKSEGY